MTVTTIGTITGTASTNLSVIPVSATVPAGTVVNVVASCSGNFAAISSIADSRGNTYAGDETQAAGARRTALWSSKLATALQSGDTITVTHGAASAARAAAAGYDPNTVGTSWFDVGQQTNGTGVGSAPTVTASGTLAQATELVWGAAIHADGPDTTTQPASWTEVLDASTGNNTHSAAYKQVAATTAPTYDPDFASVSSVAWGAAVAAYKLSAAAYTLTASVGSFTLSGQAAGLKAGRKVAAGTGSFSLSGQPAGLRATRAVAAGVGSYALTGIPAGLAAARRVAAAAGSFILTGADADLQVTTTAPSAGQNRRHQWPGRRVWFNTFDPLT